jgi:hypothetical protein
MKKYMGYIRDCCGSILLTWQQAIEQELPKYITYFAPLQHFHTSGHGSIPLDKSSPVILHFLLPDWHFHVSLDFSPSSMSLVGYTL